MYLLEIDVRTLISVLFWGNLTTLVSILTYNFFSLKVFENKLFSIFFKAKTLQTIGWLLMFCRGSIPDLLSVNLGNTLVFVGFYYEARAGLVIIKADQFYKKAVGVIALLSIAAFNFFEFAMPDANTRVVVASVCMAGVMVIPSLMLILCRDASRFKKSVGAYYLLFVVVMAIRAVYMYSNPGHLFTNVAVQAMTFMLLVLLMVFASSVYPLLLKEESDDIINTMATTDFLTGLYNRYSFLDNAKIILNRHVQSKQALSLIFCDIDNFKVINDKYGHAFGDEVLKRLAFIIKNSLRAGDLPCRYGGEEFVAMLTSAGEHSGRLVAERIMDELAKAEFAECPGFRFTISVGIVNLAPEEVDSIENLIKQADAAMYIAKNTGKNRIVESMP